MVTMTAIPTFKYSNMDLLHPDDTMDLASSPHIGADDLDFEIEEMRDASVEENAEGMMEEPQPDGREDLHIDEEIFHDDDMVDEENTIQNLDPFTNEFLMESHTQDRASPPDVDDEILYDEDDEIHNEEFGVTHIQELDVENDDHGFPNEQMPEQASETANHPDIPLIAPHEGDEDLFQPQINTNLTNHDTEDTRTTQNDGLPGFPDSAKDNNTNEQPEPSKQERGDYHPDDDTSHSPQHDLATFRDPGETNDHADIPIPPPNVTRHISNAGEESSQSHPTTDNTDEPPIQQTKSEIVPDQDGPVSHEFPRTSLHTVKINYQENEICLFPPNDDDDTETFFLSDTSLAYQSLDKLLAACREILVGTIGDDDELVLDIASLGLHISEGSSYAAKITLSSILDVYLALSHNDRSAQIQPLYCSLTSRISLASQHTYLLNAARQGKTFAEIAAEHIGSPEESVVGLEEHHEEEHNPEPFAEHSTSAEVGDGAHEDRLHNLGEDSHADRQLGESELPSKHDRDSVSHPDHQLPGETHEFEDPSAEHEFEDSEEEDGKADENDKSATSTIQGDDVETQDFGDSTEIERGVANHSVPQSDPEDSSTENTKSSVQVTERSDAHVENTIAQVDAESSRTAEADSESYEPQYRDENEGQFDFGEYREGDNNEDGSGYDQFLNEDVGDTYEAQHDDEENGEHFQDKSHVEDQTNAAVDENEHQQLTSHGVEETDSIRNPEEDDLLDFEADDEIPENAERAGSGSSDESGENGYVEKEEDLFDEQRLGKPEDVLKSATRDITPPMTPSGSKSAKRKAGGDEDEFDFVDFTTPDAKRRRPS